MNQTVTLSLTALVSLVVGAAGSYAYTNSIQANKIADLTSEIAALQTRVDEFEAAAKLEVPTDEEATAALAGHVFSGRSIRIDQCQKDTMTPGVVCSGVVITKHGSNMPKDASFCKNQRRLDLTPLIIRGA